MRTGKIKAYFLAVSAVLLLASCTPKQDIEGDIRAKYGSLQSCSMTVEIAADFGDRVSTYTISYSQTEPGTAAITIEQPPEIAGITATISEGGSELNYDGVILETGKLAGTALTPIDAVPTMLSTWASGYASELSSTQWDGVKCYQLTYSSSSGQSVIEQTAWFNAETLEPVHAETLVDGRLAISCNFKLI